MNTMTCPTCQTTQKIVRQYEKGQMVRGALIILDCAHAWELIPPRTDDLIPPRPPYERIDFTPDPDVWAKYEKRSPDSTDFHH